jgi:signal transduction histidine kinase
MELVVGPFRPALERAFAETFRRLRREDPLAPLAVVAPSRRVADRLKLLALEALPEGFAAARFFNLFSFARRIYEEAAPEGARVLLDDLLPSRLLRAILRRHFAGERYLSRAHSPGALVGALHDLKAAGVEPDAALALLAEEELGLEEAPKLAELLSLYKRYSEELRRHNRQLDEARRQAERALALAEETNRIRSEFVLMINHELRTPLTSVVTGAELLADQPGLSPGERAAILRDVVRDGRRLKELIAQMLMVARLENRGIHLTTRPVAAGEILTRLQRITRHPVQDLETPLSVDTDPDALVQLLASLADNALTHGAGSVQVRVEARLGFEPQLTVGSVPAEAVWFLVEDDGPGIPPDFLPRAFEKFEKRGRASGTGLGLYLARAVAEGIDGCIAVRTGSGGTVMAVGVPAARVEEEVPA